MIWLLLLLVSSVRGEVKELTANDFDQYIGKYPLVLVKFYAPWCGHCKRFAPIFEKAAQELAKEDQTILLANLDCTAHASVCEKYGVSGYPTVKLFKNGEFSEAYSGARTTDAVITYMLSKSKDPYTLVTSIEDISNLQKVDKPTIIAYGKHPEDELLIVFKKVADKLMRDGVFLYTHDPSLLLKSPSESIVELRRPELLHTKLEEKAVYYKGEASQHDLESFVLENGHGLVAYRTPESAFEKHDDVLVLYNDASLKHYPSGVSYYRNRLLKFIKSLGDAKPPLHFAYSCSEDYPIEEFGATVPFVVIYSAGKKYLLADYKPEKLPDFVDKFDNGRLEEYIKSEPIPTEQSEFTTKVVGRTFDKIVNDPSKDVFIVFHAPWCGHCKKLLPVFEQLAEKLKGEPNLVFALLDATANDIPEPYKVSGYPTLYFALKEGKKSPVPFEGGRELDDMLKFLAKYSTDEMVGYDRNGDPRKTDL